MNSGGHFRFTAGPILLVLICLCAAIALPLVFPYFQQTIDRRDELFTYNGTEGVFSVVPSLEGSPRLGVLISTISPGESIGWRTNMCIKPNVTGLAITKFILTNEDREISILEVPITSSDACGKRTVIRSFPLDAPKGYYEIQRTLLLHSPGHAPTTANLPPLHIQVSEARHSPNHS